MLFIKGRLRPHWNLSLFKVHANTLHWRGLNYWSCNIMRLWLKNYGEHDSDSGLCNAICIAGSRPPQRINRSVDITHVYTKRFAVRGSSPEPSNPIMLIVVVQASIFLNVGYSRGTVDKNELQPNMKISVLGTCSLVRILSLIAFVLGL